MFVGAHLHVLDMPNHSVEPVVAVLYSLSDLPVMDEIVRDFKVAESSSESASVFRQAGSGLPDKPLKALNPVNSQCKSVCCTVLIHN